MQIVIDIPEKTANKIKDNVMFAGTIPSEILWDVSRAISNGTPLPAGHGRLIDADELKKHKYHDSDRFENAVAVAQIDWAKTIVEADEEVQNEDD